MALITCPECGRQISDTAKNCIQCGANIEECFRRARAQQTEAAQNSFFRSLIKPGRVCIVLPGLSEIRKGHYDIKKQVGRGFFAGYVKIDNYIETGILPGSSKEINIAYITLGGPETIHIDCISGSFTTYQHMGSYLIKVTPGHVYYVQGKGKETIEY